MGGGFADGRSLRKRRREEDESSSDNEGGAYVEVGEDSGDDEESTSSSVVHSLVSRHEPSIPGRAIGGTGTAMAASTVNSWNQLSMTDLKL